MMPGVVQMLGVMLKILCCEQGLCIIGRTGETSSSFMGYHGNDWLWFNSSSQESIAQGK
jgi:hypothetical protein